jgi:hypothetical protein
MPEQSYYSSSEWVLRDNSTMPLCNQSLSPVDNGRASHWESQLPSNGCCVTEEEQSNSTLDPLRDGED